MHMTISDTARRLGVSRDVILKIIAIDEISVGKGHKHLTIVPDIITGAVIFAGDGKGADAPDPFRNRLKPESAEKIKAALSTCHQHI